MLDYFKRCTKYNIKENRLACNELNGFLLYAKNVEGLLNPMSDETIQFIKTILKALKITFEY